MNGPSKDIESQNISTSNSLVGQRFSCVTCKRKEEGVGALIQTLKNIWKKYQCFL